MDSGWIKIHRKLMEKGYYTDSEYVHLWVHLLFRANHKETEVMFNNELIKLKKGQFITGRNVLSEETGIKPWKIERILKLFKSAQQIEQQTNTRFRLITVKNWDEYQKNEQASAQQVNNKPTADQQQINTDKNLRIKELKNNTEKVAPLPLEDQIKPFREKYPEDTIKAFLNYWTEKNPGGKKERWQMQKVFDISRRLVTWTGKEWNKEKKSGSNPNERILHDGTKAIKNFGKWVDANNPNVTLDLHYYPELAKDI